MSPQHESSATSPSGSEGSSLWNRSKRALGGTGRNFTFLHHVPKTAEAHCNPNHYVTPSTSVASSIPKCPPRDVTSHHVNSYGAALMTSGQVQPFGKTEAQSAKDAHTRRREQVRRAQRNHRERKENYIKSLEEEVLRLRDEEASIVQDSKAVQDENAMLRDIMARNGISIPDRTKQMHQTATVSIQSGVNGANRLQVTLPEAMDLSPSAFEDLPSPVPASSYTSSHDSGRPIRSQQESHAFEDPLRERRARSSSTSLDNHQIGIDFVLSLEQPCLGHTRSNLSKDVPSGHALTAQAPLLTAAPSDLSLTSSWQVPAVEIERLLELSSNLNLFGEITPVQAWSRIRSYPGFEHLDRDGLEGLKFALMAEVQCYGFGAVVDEVVFEGILQQTFSKP